MKHAHILIILLLTVVHISQAQLLAPNGWEAQELPAGVPVLLLATHENNGGIAIIKESKSDYETKNLEEFLKVKVSNFETEHGITELKKLGDSTVSGMPSKVASFRVNMPDGKGTKVDLRYMVACSEKEGSYYTFLLSCRVDSESSYNPKFGSFMRSVKLD